MRTNSNPLLPYHEEKLASGFTLVHKDVPVAPIVALDFWIHTGAIHDPEPALGLSHFYEHMFFKGTERFGVGEMDRIITSLGGYNNAATSLDYTHYYVVLPRAGWRDALEVMIDSLLNPQFDPEEIERERSVILEEIKRHEDNPWSKIYDEFIRAAFANSRYSRKVLGEEETLHAINRDTFVQYRQERYCPENATLCVVGDIRLEEITEALNELLPQQPEETFTEPDDEWRLIDAPQEVVLHRDVNQAYLLIGFPTPRTLGQRDEYALDLLGTLVGEGRSSRLYRRLQDELGLVSSIGSTYWSLKYAGLFLIEAVTEPDKVEQVEAEINEVLKQIPETLGEDELKRVKSMEHADYAFTNERIASIAQTYGFSRLTTNIDHAVDYLNRIDETSLDDIREAHARHLQPNHRCRGLLLPKD